MSSTQEQIKKRAYYLWLDGYDNNDEDRYYHAEKYHYHQTNYIKLCLKQRDNERNNERNTDIENYKYDFKENIDDKPM